ncbi:unnamed protein product [Mytilus edulis]|uniref:Uncharacterized protein n=1 Tax=Mytilus edulis TaxID=6550 RepID=A0A8S3ULI5_MYTED|nr:unnamed protein product [Mytilus edulis]
MLRCWREHYARIWLESGCPLGLMTYIDDKQRLYVNEIRGVDITVTEEGVNVVEFLSEVCSLLEHSGNPVLGKTGIKDSNLGCRGHKGAVTKLLVKFDELKSKTDTEVDEVKALDDAVTQKQKTLIDLNNRLLEQTSEENLEQEITDSDEYMYELDCKIRQIRKFIKSFETNTIISHDTVGPSTSRLNPDAYHFTPEARVDMNRCAIDSMNQQYSINAPAKIRESESSESQNETPPVSKQIPESDEKEETVVMDESRTDS